MTSKRIQYTTDDPDKFALEEMTKKTEEICERATDQGVLKQLPSRIDMKKKTLIIGGSTATIVGLLLYSLTIVPLAQGSTDDNCIDIDFLK